jgi:cytochrome c551/c552
MKKFSIILLIAAFAYACGNQSNTPTPAPSNDDASKAETGNPAYDPNRGVGKFTKVDVSPTLNIAMADNGVKVYNVKCASCHKLTDEKLVGPGWKDVTKRFTAEWIMNFATNTDEMLNKDPKAQAQLEICLVRMPNQNLSDDDARHVYEFMRKNDGIK